MRRGIPTARKRGRLAAALLVLVFAPGRHADADRAILRVRASEAFAACLGPALDAFSRRSGVNVVLDVGDPDPPRQADVVVGDDSETTRLLESGDADLATSFDLGAVPWVTVVPEGSPAGALSAVAPDRVAVLGGRAGRAARESLGNVAPDRLAVSRSPQELRAAPYALVPRSLAGPGEQRPSSVPPLIAVAAVIAKGPRVVGAHELLAFLHTDAARRLLSPCFDAVPSGGGASAGSAHSAAAATFAQSVVDWWLPDCTLRTNGYNNPGEILGAPNAVFSGTKDQYSGMMSLGQGGWVTVDMGDTATDGPGADIRVYQVTSNEPVTLYGSTSSQGPFTLIALREDCGTRVPGAGNWERYCDFDLRGTGLAEARYLKVEDGEIYPCLSAGTISEGADIDAIEILNKK
jgi:hypothetical protein